MEIFYHGSSVLFDKFDLSHALEGDGKVKFGYGVYVTQEYATAAHYAFNDKRPENDTYYVYTVEIPSLTPDNHLFQKQVVPESIIRRTEEKLGEAVPEEVLKSGDSKDFRKYIGNRLLQRDGNAELQNKTVKFLMTKASVESEKAAAGFFESIGLECYVWPRAWSNPEITNRAILDDSKVKILKIEKVELDEKKHQLIEGSQQLISSFKKESAKADKKPSVHSIASFIQQYYPEYWGIQKYPASQCIAIRKAEEKWGILGNYGKASVTVNGFVFQKTEQLFQMMKFRDAGILKELSANSGMGLKMKAKHYETEHRRPDWGSFILDAMKFCLMTKYEQSAEFRETLDETKGKFIVEDQTSFPKKNADAWGVKRIGDEFVGPSILGRMLMELRDTGKLEYHLPDDALDFIELLKDE